MFVWFPFSMASCCGFHHTQVFRVGFGPSPQSSRPRLVFFCASCAAAEAQIAMYHISGSEDVRRVSSLRSHTTIISAPTKPSTKETKSKRKERKALRMYLHVNICFIDVCDFFLLVCSSSALFSIMDHAPCLHLHPNDTAVAS